MRSSDLEARNASGLTPNETKALNERKVASHETRIIESIKEVNYERNRYRNDLCIA